MRCSLCQLLLGKDTIRLVIYDNQLSVFFQAAVHHPLQKDFFLRLGLKDFGSFAEHGKPEFPVDGIRISDSLTQLGAEQPDNGVLIYRFALPFRKIAFLRQACNF